MSGPFLLEDMIEHEKVPGKFVPFRLELLSSGTLSLYYLERKYQKLEEHPESKLGPLFKKKVRDIYIPQEETSYSYCFNPEGKLKSLGLYRGNFTEKDFRWDEQRKYEFTGLDLPPSEIKPIRELAQKISQRIEERCRQAQTLNERDYYQTFLSVLQKIIK